MPIESKFPRHLADNLNAEIVLGEGWHQRCKWGTTAATITPQVPWRQWKRPCAGWSTHISISACRRTRFITAAKEARLWGGVAILVSFFRTSAAGRIFSIQEHYLTLYSTFPHHNAMRPFLTTVQADGMLLNAFRRSLLDAAVKSLNACRMAKFGKEKKGEDVSGLLLLRGNYSWMRVIWEGASFCL